MQEILDLMKRYANRWLSPPRPAGEPFRVPQNEDVLKRRSRSEIVCLMSIILMVI